MSSFTIHQPMFAPPIYLLARFIKVSDLIMLTTDFAKSDGWHTRFKLHNKSGPFVVPVPLGSRHNRQISQLQIANPERFFSKLRTTLQQSYGRSPHFEQLIALLPETDNFSDFSVGFLRNVFQYLGVGPRIHLDTDLGVQRPNNASEWLTALGLAVGGSQYVCAADAPAKYLDKAPFDLAGIDVQGQQYDFPTSLGYDAQTSIIHLLFKEEPARVRLLLAL